MASLDDALQVAIFGRLSAYPPLVALIEDRVYDLPPQDAPYPYVTIGEGEAHQADVTGKRAVRAYCKLHAWSDYKGYREVKDIASAIEDALHEYPLTVEGFRLISITHLRTIPLRAPDGLLSHSVIEFVSYVERI